MTDKISSHVDGNIKVIEMEGRLVRGSLVDGLGKEVAEAISKKQPVLFNMAGVDYLDSSGIGELTRSHTGLEDAGLVFGISNVHKRVIDKIALCKLDDVLNIYPDNKKGLEQLPLVKPVPPQEVLRATGEETLGAGSR